MADLKAKLGEWVSPQFLLTGVTLLVAIILAYSSIKSDVRDIGTQMQAQNDRAETRTQQYEESRRQLESRVLLLEQSRITERELRAGDRELIVELRGDVKYIKEQIDKRP
jgi:hypothetical protein